MARRAPATPSEQVCPGRDATPCSERGQRGQHLAVVGVGEQLGGGRRGQPAQLVDLGVGLEGAALDAHRPVADALGAVLGVPVAWCSAAHARAPRSGRSPPAPRGRRRPARRRRWARACPSGSSSRGSGAGGPPPPRWPTGPPRPCRRAPHHAAGGQHHAVCITQDHGGGSALGGAGAARPPQPWPPIQTAASACPAPSRPCATPAAGSRPRRAAAAISRPATRAWRRLRPADDGVAQPGLGHHGVVQLAEHVLQGADRVGERRRLRDDAGRGLGRVAGPLGLDAQQRAAARRWRSARAPSPPCGACATAGPPAR